MLSLYLSTFSKLKSKPYLAPVLKLHCLYNIHIRIPEEDGRSSRHTFCIFHTSLLQSIFNWLDIKDTNTKVTITSSMGWSAL